MVSETHNNINRPELTISGLKLLPAQVRLLLKVVEKNDALKHLSMCRKKIADEDGIEIAKSLFYNKGLQNIELEGNNLGPGAAEKLGEMLMKNVTLRVMSLEANNLTSAGKESKGIESIGKVNRSLRSVLPLTSLGAPSQHNAGLLESELHEPKPGV